MKIVVPDIESPLERLCYKQAEDMTRCDRKKDHHGMHSWEMFSFIKQVQKLLEKLLDDK